MSWRLALHTGSYGSLPLAEALRVTREAGWDGIELRHADFAKGLGDGATISELLAQNGIPTTVDMHIRALDDLGGLDVLGTPKVENQYHAAWGWAGSTPYKGVKLLASHFGGTRNPMAVRWPAKIPAGTVSNEIVQHHDWLPTFLAAAGEPEIVDKLKAGHTIGETTYKVHIDGYNLLPYLTGETDKSPRPGLVYFSDDGDVLAIRYDNWKVVFMEQRVQGTLRIWAEPFVALRVPKLFNLRTDPFERADVTSNTYYDWLLDHTYIALAAMALVTQFLATFEEFPPRQKAASFTIDQAVEKLEAALTSGR
jgi:arylsulfatase